MAKKHFTTVNGWQSSLKNLAVKIIDMRYDKVLNFFEYLAQKFKLDSENDTKNNKPQLSKLLLEISEDLEAIIQKLKVVWQICKNYENK